ncbi:MAG: translation initiation factor IF-2 [Chitinophagaceae bacterium]
MIDNKSLPRLTAAAKEFNIGKDTLIEFLGQKGFKAEELTHNSKLTQEMYEALQKEFQDDKITKIKSDQIEIYSKQVKEEVAEKTPIVTEPSVIKAEISEIQPPKIVDKVELDSINKSNVEKLSKKKSRPKSKQASKVDAIDLFTPVSESEQEILSASQPFKEEVIEIVEEVIFLPVVEENKEEEQPVVVTEKVIEVLKTEEPPLIETKIKKLEQLKIIGKIDLPVDPPKVSNTHNQQDSRDTKKKRKRIVIAKPSKREDDKKQKDFNKQYDRKPKEGEKYTPVDNKAVVRSFKNTQAKIVSSSHSNRNFKSSKYRRDKRESLQHKQPIGAFNVLKLTEFISVSELASLMNVSVPEVIGKCMSLGMMVSINQRIDAEVIELVANEFNYEVQFVSTDFEDNKEEQDAEEDLEPRIPIVTIMGHVDHGKTSLLDYIRSSNVVAGEAGGITQHIGAYEVTLENGKQITFLDTPGHEAFTAMRARGAKVTDIVVIVIAADDAIMPQTREAISHAQAASVSMIFAINKIDKEGANPEKIKEQLANMNLLVEDWGGQYQCQEISAKKGLNVDLLLEKILLEAEIQNLKSNPNKLANGTIIEASLDKGRGYVTNILVQNGTLRVGDMMLAGHYYGKVKAMFNERDKKINEASPSTPVLVLGLNGAPQSGESFKVYVDESEVKQIASKREQLLREQGLRAQKHITLDEIGRRRALGNFRELKLIIKGDVDGSIEALGDSLQKLSTDEIVITVVHKAVGQISESDVLLASASDAIIIGFQVRPSLQANKLAEEQSIQIKTYSIIYNAIEETKNAIEGMLQPTVTEVILGNAEIRNVFKIDKVVIAGCFVIAGKVNKNAKVRVVRDGIVVYPSGDNVNAELSSLKRYKDDVKEVGTNMECGLTVKNYSDIKVGDILEFYEIQEIKRTL